MRHTQLFRFGSVLLLIGLFTAAVQAAVGDLDSSFGTNGMAAPTISDFNLTYQVALQDDGKIIIAGDGLCDSCSAPASIKPLAARFTVDGLLDTTFSADGLNFPIETGAFTDIIVQPDGKIIAVGWRQPADNSAILLTRYLANGELDESFDGGDIFALEPGFIFTDLGDEERAYAAALQADNKIIVAGWALDADTNQPVSFIIRYNENGSLDTTFDTDGIVLINDYETLNITINFDGKILVTGYKQLDQPGPTRSDLFIARYNEDGSVDTTFGFNGVVTTDVADNERGSGLIIQPDQKIVVVGEGGNWDDETASYSDLVLIRYNIDGTLDNSFGNNGVVTQTGELGFPVLIGLDVALQSDGKLVVTGYGHTADTSSAPIPYYGNLSRYHHDGSLDTGFGNQGVITETLSSGLLWTSVVIQPEDGKILAAGIKATTEAFLTTLARYEVAQTTTETIANLATSSSPTPTELAITNQSGQSCTFTTTRHPVPPGGAPADPGEMPMYWQLTSDCDPLTADLRFNYTDVELLYSNTVTETDLQAFQSVSGTHWVNQCALYTCTLDLINNSLLIEDVTVLGYWALGTDATNAPPKLVADSNTLFSWTPNDVHCRSDLYRRAGLDGDYVSIAQGLRDELYDFSADLGDTAVHHFYYVQVSGCLGLGGPTTSNTIGEFEFALTPGN